MFYLQLVVDEAIDIDVQYLHTVATSGFFSNISCW
ncbi:hypothetical protein BVRB_012500 isoform B [Beta vulgaris subsp. vulgaris]|nr:hypothetical protein BVRB_012500 isoform B [Beta vulgaris subsp. vulgaris]